MKHKKIIFVCTGNTCRSPMAAAALRQELKKRKIAWFNVQSAGLGAEEGAPMAAHAAQALREAKISFAENFTSRRLTEKMIKEAYAVVCVSEAHREKLKNFPNVTSMRALCDCDIPDPYGQGIEVYRETLRNIRLCLPGIIEGLGLNKKLEEEES